MNDLPIDLTVALAEGGDAEARRRIAGRLSGDPLHQALFGPDVDAAAIDARLEMYRAVLPAYAATAARLGIQTPCQNFLFDMIVPLTQLFRARVMACSHAYLIAIGGGPAAGKTTLSTLLAACLHAVIAPPTRCLSLSLDDFYLAREERQRRGFKWRTLPGTHDTKRLEAFVAALDRTSHPLSVPRYDLGRDRPMQDEILAGAPGLCVFDGAMVGSRLPGYDALARRIDFFIYLDVPIRQLKAWRFQRERRIRENSGGQAGFSEAQMSDFWAEALRPSIEQWVMPNAEIADLVLKIGPNRTVLGARRQTPPREARRA